MIIMSLSCIGHVTKKFKGCVSLRYAHLNLSLSQRPSPTKIQEKGPCFGVLLVRRTTGNTCGGLHPGRNRNATEQPGTRQRPNVTWPVPTDISLSATWGQRLGRWDAPTCYQCWAQLQEVSWHWVMDGNTKRKERLLQMERAVCGIVILT